MKNLVDQINAQIEAFQVNAAAQVEKGNKAAGTRARKAALELGKLLKEFRKVSVEEAKNKFEQLFFCARGCPCGHPLFFMDWETIVSFISYEFRATETPVDPYLSARCGNQSAQHSCHHPDKDARPTHQTPR